MTHRKSRLEEQCHKTLDRKVHIVGQGLLVALLFFVLAFTSLAATLLGGGWTWKIDAGTADDGGEELLLARLDIVLRRSEEVNFECLLLFSLRP